MRLTAEGPAPWFAVPVRWFYPAVGAADAVPVALALALCATTARPGAGSTTSQHLPFEQRARHGRLQGQDLRQVVTGEAPLISQDGEGKAGWCRS